MSTQLDLYLELNHNNQSWININNKNIFDGFDLVDTDVCQPLPAFSYPCDHSFIHDLKQIGLDIHQLNMRDISIQSQAIYKTLSNEVTGNPDGLNIYTVSIQELITRIMNSYYYQLNLAGDQSLLLPDNRHKAPIKQLWQNIRLVGWIDA